MLIESKLYSSSSERHVLQILGSQMRGFFFHHNYLTKGKSCFIYIKQMD